ncbi:glycine oxidase ThiO [alpha proteobacterium U9-1i]|nr:glycine oxidase ThiO [alpha proteobacterium U9-1i]
MKKVVIVGAGVVGLFCALRLAKSGAQVIVLEGEREDFSVYGPTASLAAAGMLAPLSEATGDADERALALQSFDMWKRLTPGSMWEDGVRFDGAVVVAPDDALRARADGRALTPLNAAQWKKRTGLETRIDSGVFIEDEGVADPVRVLSGLAMDARRHGVQTLFANDVGAVTGSSVESYDTGVYEADVVLLAPGVWASEAMADVAPALKHVTPAKGQIVPVTLPRSLGPNVHAPGFYLARRMDDDVVLGATMEVGKSDRFPSEEGAQMLLAAAERVFPGEVRQREKGWAGVRPMSPDGAPMVGKNGDVWIATGHSRNGWLLAPITAEILATEIMGGEADPLWKRYSPDRFAAS